MTTIEAPPERVSVESTSCDWCASTTVAGGVSWAIRAFVHRSGPLGPAARRITTRHDAGTRDACARCAPLVRNGSAEQLATRNVLNAAIRQDATTDVLPHGELVALFRAVDAALVR